MVGTAFSATAVAAGIEAEVEQVEEWCEVLVKRGQFLQAQEPSALPDGTICGSYKFLHTLSCAVRADADHAAVAVASTGGRQ